jgi:hypothetical protein
LLGFFSFSLVVVWIVLLRITLSVTSSFSYYIFLILWGDNAPFVEDSGLLAGLANIVVKIGIPVLAVVLSKTYILFA